MRTGLAGLLLLLAAGAQAQGTVYRCPGNPESYSNLLSPEEARQKGCRTIEGAPISIVQTPRPRPAAAAASGAAPAPAAGARPAESRVDAADQRARDSDARRILGDELRREEARLAEMKKEYNNGEPERQGGERNYQKYLDRVAEMKAAIERKEADVAALKRELAKLPS
jgi:hypothetical protein